MNPSPDAAGEALLDPLAPVRTSGVPPRPLASAVSIRGLDAAFTSEHPFPAPLQAVVEVLQVLLDAVERDGYGEVVDTVRGALRALGVVDAARPRPHDVRNLAFRVAAAVHAVLEDGRAEGEEAEVLRLALDRVRSGTLDFDRAAESLEADPRWGARGLTVLENGRRVPLTRDLSWSMVGMSAAHAIDPAAGAAEVLAIREVGRLLEAAGARAEGALTGPETHLLASLELARAGGDLPRITAPLLVPMVKVLGLDPFARVEAIDATNAKTITKELEAGTLHARIEIAGTEVAVAYRPPAELVEAARARLELGELGGLPSELQATLREVLSAGGDAIAADLDDELSSQGWRAVATEATKLATVAFASAGVGAVAELGVAAALARGMALGPSPLRAAQAARFLTQTLAFTTLLSATDGRWSAERYGLDLVFCGAVGAAARGAGILATAFARLLPGEALAQRFGRFALARGMGTTGAAAGSTTAEAALMGVEDVLEGADADLPRWQALARSFERHLAAVTLLQVAHMGIVRARSSLAFGRPGRLGAEGAAVAELEARGRALAETMEATFEAQLDALASRNLARAERLDRVLAERSREVWALADDVEHLAERMSPVMAELARRGTRAATETWRYVATPGARPAVEVEAAWARARTGHLGAPAPTEVGVRQRLRPRDPEIEAAWARAMALGIEATRADIGAGRLRSIDAVLVRGGALARAAAQASGRTDLGPRQSLEHFGQPRAPETEMWTPSQGYPGYREGIARLLDRAPRPDVFTHPRGFPLTSVEDAVGWIHTAPELLPALKTEMAAAWRRGLEARTREALVEAAATFHWWGVQATPYRRGSAGAVDALTRALLLAGGRGGSVPVAPGRWREGVAADLEAFHLSLPEYVRRYPSFFDPSPLPGPR